MLFLRHACARTRGRGVFRNDQITGPHHDALFAALDDDAAADVLRRDGIPAAPQPHETLGVHPALAQSGELVSGNGRAGGQLLFNQQVTGSASGRRVDAGVGRVVEPALTLCAQVAHIGERAPIQEVVFEIMHHPARLCLSCAGGAHGASGA